MSWKIFFLCGIARRKAVPLTQKRLTFLATYCLHKYLLFVIQLCVQQILTDCSKDLLKGPFSLITIIR